MAISYVETPDRPGSRGVVRARGGRPTVEADVSAYRSSRWSSRLERARSDRHLANAGIETIVPFLDLTDEQWTRLTDVNLRNGCVLRCSAGACEGGRRHREYRIDSVSQGPSRSHALRTNEAGAEALTRNISCGNDPLGIRVNACIPASSTRR